MKDLQWEQRIAKKYWDKLFKEYAICDLTFYKSTSIALKRRQTNIFFKKIEWHFDGELKKKSSVGKANLNVLKRKSAQKKMVCELGKSTLAMSKVNVVKIRLSFVW